MGDRFPCTDEQVYKLKKEIVDIDNEDKDKKRDFDKEIDESFQEYANNLESAMWKGLVFFIVLCLAAVFIWLIVHKPLL